MHCNVSTPLFYPDAVLAAESSSSDRSRGGGPSYSQAKLIACKAKKKIIILKQNLLGLKYFNFQWTKILYQNNIISIILHSFLHFSKAYKCDKSYEITLKKRFLLEPKKTNLKSLIFHKIKSYA